MSTASIERTLTSSKIICPVWVLNWYQVQLGDRIWRQRQPTVEPYAYDRLLTNFFYLFSPISPTSSTSPASSMAAIACFWAP
ncbi:MAG: hypothetical protein KME15_06450 [Drouetiella hepatica Uher 2000/2452]|uniref:Uncharacterized protein n=1 Tax=Drouetiella hepatica Uher 2000/2452 TaxID=904376 RepID=A0A951ULH7_9CYAN|nr:hypothetical protein [Drouetiella hepatica Uher 2000/2452]